MFYHCIGGFVCVWECIEMAFIIKLVAVLAITTATTAQYSNYPLPKPHRTTLPSNLQSQHSQKLPLPYQQPRTFASLSASAPGIDSYLPLIQKYVPGASLTLNPNQNNPSSYLPLSSIQKNAQSSYLPLNPSQNAQSSYLPLTQQQLPSLEAPNVPFYSPQPSTDLRPPSANAQATGGFYQVPVPSQDLQVPSQMRWNPENDANFFYNNEETIAPVKNDFIKDELPTNVHPKKYNKDIHATAKPYAKVKEDLGLYADPETPEKKKTSEKLRNTYAKNDNQKRLRGEKVQKPKKHHKHAKTAHATSAAPSVTSAIPAATKSEPQTAATGYQGGFDSEGVEHHTGGFSEGLNAQLSAALGSGHHHHSPKERLEFQMHGHDGPHSYKWGFDHGEGHDRQFRIEERDKSGNVKGLYGYYDEHGKLQMVNYDADPHEGFHADTPVGKF